jgi:chromosomal replication initiator protein
MDKLWKDVRAALKKRVPTHSFRMWIDPLELAGGEDGDWTITCPNAFSKKRVQEHFGELIEAELRRVAGDAGCRIRFHVAGRRNGQRAEVDVPIPTTAG